MTLLTLAILAWGALAFGAVYDWAFWPLLAACAAVGVWGLSRRASRARSRPNLPVTMALVLVACAIGAQLIPIERATLLRLSPGTDTFLRQYDVGYALRVVLESQSANSTPARGQRSPSTPAGPIVHPLSVNPQKTQLGLAFLGAFALMLLGLSRGLSGRDLRSLVPALAALGVVMALVAMVQRAFWNGKVYGLWEPENPGAQAFGPFINRNHFAGWILMALPLVIGAFASHVAKGMPGVRGDWRSRLLWFSTPDASRVVLLGVSTVVMGLSLALTMSRSGISGFLLAMLLSSYFVVRKQEGSLRGKLLATFFVLVFVAAVSRAGFDPIAERFSTIGPDLGGRAGAWADAWRIRQQFPVFGTGFNTYGTATTMLQEFEVKTAHYVEAHNDYLQVLVEGGYLVVVPALVLMVVIAGQIRRRFAEGHDDRTGYWLRLGAVTGLTAMLFQETVEFSLQMPGNAALFVVLCAIALRRATPRGSKVEALRQPKPLPLRQTKYDTLAVFVCVLAAGGLGACGGRSPESKAVQATYSKTTGKLERLAYDSNNDGKLDTWSHMDGARLLQMDIDTDFNGIVDRWEYYTPGGALEKVGFSRAKDGTVDAWAFAAPDGQLSRVEVSTKRDGKITRREQYEQGALVSAEEDTDGDGQPDRWETYRAGSLATLTLDTARRGRPDRRLTYGPSGVTVEQLK